MGVKSTFFLLIIIWAGKVFSQSDTSLIFSEIMFNPQPGNNEFIEIYNRSATDVIDLNNYGIIYYTSNQDTIVSAGFGKLLQPQSYAVIFEGDYDLNSGIYNGLIPSNTLILKINDDAFGSNGMANSSDRPVRLVDNLTDTLSVYTYSANNNTAVSDEKIILNSDNSQSNWANSLNENGTPGFRNTVTILNDDIEISEIYINPEYPFDGDDVDIFTKVKNTGLNEATNYSIQIYNDLNYDSLGQTSEIIFNQNFLNLLPGDSNTVNTTLNNLPQGNYQIISKAVYANDEDTLNNKKIFDFQVLPPGNNYNDVVINELMYAPSPDEPEWIELYNNTSSSINLKGWQISDNTTTPIITNDNIFINPGSFVVLSKDSTIFNFYDIPANVIVLDLPSLNNSGDDITLKDSLGIKLDSVSYSPDWGGNSEGRSLERISSTNNSNDPENWGTSESIYKATPGKINSITIKDFDLKIASFKPEKDFGIVGQPVQFKINVRNAGLNQSGNYTLKFYRDLNADSIPQPNEYLNSINGYPINSGDSILDIFSTSNFIEGENYFICKLETSQDQDTTNNIAFTSLTGVQVNEIRNDLVLNEFMYAPNSNGGEWIEIYNRSSKVINIKNYQISDNRDTVKVINGSAVLNPDDYFVIASDSSILNYYNIPSSYVITNFPSLNNAGDKLILIDSLNRTIDSLEYSSVWGGKNGKSLERISADNSSTDSTNWKTSISRLNGTPGFINSVTQKDNDVELSNVLYFPKYPAFGDDISFSVKVKNLGNNNAVFDLKFYEDTNLDSIPDKLLETKNQINLISKDSVLLPINYKLNNIHTKKQFYAKVIFQNDQDTTNNYLLKSVKPGYPGKTLIINEIMYTPQLGEPEWVEIYNTSNDSINLINWEISDVVSTPTYIQINQDIYIPSKSYLIITKDSTILDYHRVIPSKIIHLNLPSLNNSSEGVVLIDDRGMTMDSVFYFNDWGGTNGYSLERKEFSGPSNLKSNWGTSEDIEFSTPGRINSITPKNIDVSIKEISFTPRFPVPGDNVYINAKIQNTGSSSASNIKVNFYIDTDSNLVVDKLLSSQSGLNLESKDSLSVQASQPINNLTSKTLAAVKIFLNNDEDTLNNYTESFIEPGYSQNTVLINEVMYAPLKNEPEWIEIKNVSSKEIDLKNWSVSDLLTTPTENFISTESLKLEPEEYLIIASDTSFYSYYPDFNSKIVFTDFGSLGNSEDGILIYDFRNGIIDSLKYNSNWGGKNGHSLERISFSKETSDSSNWATSLDISGSTPGKDNSILNIPDYKRNDLVINEIMFDPEVDNSEFIEFYNNSEDSINIGGWKIEDENYNSFRLSDTTINLNPKNYFVLAADSGIIKNYNLNNHKSLNILDNSSLGLSNQGELILLKDIRGNVIDSVWYSTKWHNRNFNSTKNISLERINPKQNGNDPSNWSSSVDNYGATPEKQNSIFTENSDLSSQISVSPNPFSPDNDGFEDFTMINYNLDQRVAQIRIKIFDSQGRLVRTLVNNKASGSKGSVIFDGLDNSGRALRIGIYIVFLEALNESSGILDQLKTVVVVARKL